MKPRKLISIFALLLAATLLLTTSAIAQSQEKEVYDGYPIIALPGINHSPSIYCDENDEPILDAKGNPMSGTLFIFNKRELFTSKEFVLCVISAIRTLVNQSECGLSDAAYDVAMKALEIQRTDNEGNAVNNLKVERYSCPIGEAPSRVRDDGTEETYGEWVNTLIPYLPIVDKKIDGNDMYWFTFPLIGDPMQSAAELDDYIQQVKESTGKDKVNLLSISLGGTVLAAYLDEYGWEDINQVTNVVSSLDGTEIIADFMARNFNLETSFFYYDYLFDSFKSENSEATAGLVYTLIRLLPKEQLQSFVSSALSGMLDGLMLTNPQFWSAVPADRYDELAQRYLSDADDTVLRAKTDRMQTAKINLESNLKKMAAEGIQVDNISGSNLRFGEQFYSYFEAVNSAAETNSDGVISLASASVGATGATPGTTLPDTWKQSVTYAADPSYSYISPDRTVDVSTAALPDNTWIFLGQHHECGHNMAVINLAIELITNDEFTDVHYKPDIYPQFNYQKDDKHIWRWYMGDLESIDRTELTAQECAEIDAAMALGEGIMTQTIADADAATEATAQIRQVLIKYHPNYEPDDENAAKLNEVLVKVSRFVAKAELILFGDNGFSDGLNLDFSR